jgi:CheY-like chemotaxis protein
MSTQLQSQGHAALPHVLVVDDDPTIRDLVSDYLGKTSCA